MLLQDENSWIFELLAKCCCMFLKEKSNLSEGLDVNVVSNRPHKLILAGLRGIGKPKPLINLIQLWYYYVREMFKGKRSWSAVALHK